MGLVGLRGFSSVQKHMTKMGACMLGAKMTIEISNTEINWEWNVKHRANQGHSVESSICT